VHQQQDRHESRLAPRVEEDARDEQKTFLPRAGSTKYAPGRPAGTKEKNGELKTMQ
jgi:hypothetical protein